MPKICPYCSQVIDNDSTICTHCNNNITIEIASEDEPFNIIETTSVNNLTEQEEIIEDNQLFKLQEVEVTVNNLDEITIYNPTEESVNEVNIIAQPDNVEIPNMPAPEIGEISPYLLGNIYDKQEAINNERKEIKRKLEEEAFERKRQEEEAKRKKPMKKPDLLAGINEAKDDLEPDNLSSKGKKEKKKMRKIMDFIIIILIIAIVIVAAFYLPTMFNKESELYMEPIRTYFDGYTKANADLMLSSYVPCLSKTEEVTSLVSNSINTRNQYDSIEIVIKEKNIEVVNDADKNHLDSYLEERCGTEEFKKQNISGYKHIFVEQETKTSDSEKTTKTEPEFWIVEIENKWYILLIQ